MFMSSPVAKELDQNPKSEKWGRIGIAGIALIVSTASFMVSGANLYLTQLRTTPIEVVMGQELALYYPEDGGFGMYVPISFVNTGGRGGIILRVRAILSRFGYNRNYEFEWAGFTARDSRASKIETVYPEALGIASTSTTSKRIWFAWRPHMSPEFVLQEGSYTIKIAVWTTNSKGHDINVSKTFIIDEKTAKILIDRRNNQDPGIYYVTFDGGQAENEVTVSQ